MQHIYAHLLRFLFLIVIAFPGYADKFVRTTASGSGDGSSWDNASGNLQGMINAAATGEAIYVAAGTYKPESYPEGCLGCTGPQDYAFNMRNVRIYGGFPDTGEPTLAERDTALYKTILSGDLSGNDWISFFSYSLELGGYEDNVRHVVVSVNETDALIDGITIMSGSAMGTTGIMVEGEQIEATKAGGVYMINSKLTLTHCNITRNQSYGNGGAVFSINGTLTVNESTCRYNIAAFGGGFYTTGGGRLEINGSLIDSNKGYGVPAIYAVGSELIIRNSFIVNNLGQQSLLIYAGQKPSEFTNTVIYGNRVGNFGLLTFVSAEAKITNCTIAGNAQSAYTIFASGISISSGYANVRNTIIAENTGGGFTCLSGYGFTAYNSMLQYMPGYYSGTGNQEYGGPSFVNAADADGPDNLFGTADDGLRLTKYSSAIDAGITSGAPTEDILGNPVYNLSRDLGAYENLEGMDIYAGQVDCNGSGEDNVMGHEWYHLFNGGKIMAINPNGMNLGTVTVDISDAPDVITYNGATLLGRTFNVHSSRYGTAKLPASYTVRFYFTDEELAQYNLATSGNFTPADFLLSYREGGSGCSLANYGGTIAGMVNPAAVTSGEYGQDNYGFYLQATLDHFTIFAASTEPFALPVDLVSFKGTALETHNLLEWETASEYNNAYFEVQRSADGKTFTPVGEHVAGTGDSRNLSAYRFTDNAPATGVNYYRLKQVDWDGTFVLSRMIAVVNKAAIATLYPNPAGHAIRVHSPAAFRYHILNVAGIICLQGDGLGDEPINIETLPAGIYFLTIHGTTQKFTKE